MANLSRVLQYFIPQPCPYPLIRIGGSSDGAYLIPKDFNGIIACFSPGVCNAKDFEDELAEKHGIRSHLCDFSSDQHLLKTPLIEGMQTFEKKWLDLKNSATSLTLHDWVRNAESGELGDLILQMDIEGAEYRNLIYTPEECLNRFRIIVVEIHDLGRFEDKLGIVYAIKQAFKELVSKSWLPIRRGIGSLPKNIVIENVVSRLGGVLEPYLIEKFARKISKTHVCVHAHPNNCCGEFIDKETGMNVPRVLELTFLRRDRLKAINHEFISPKVPHPLDIVNVPENSPLELNSRWTRLNA